ncbi:MAG: GGDEF family protein [uncultured bacterium]|nr:MAG: GGDEF family protein [uncultured bacterium]
MIKQQIELIVPEDIIKSWQEIADLLSQICQVPSALIMRLSRPNIEVFVSSSSKDNPYHPGDKEHLEGSGLYCETVINSRNKLLIPDAMADECWKNNPDVKLNMISYLGFPILRPDGDLFGTICLLDNKRNEYSQTIEQLMLKFKGIIEDNLALIYMNQVLGDKAKRLTDYLMEIQALRGLVTICSNCRDIKDKEGQWRPVDYYLIRHPEADFSHGLCPKCSKKLYPDFEDQ